MYHLRRVAVLIGVLFTSAALGQESSPPSASPPPRPEGANQRPNRTAAQNPFIGSARVPESVQYVRDVIYATAPGDDGKPIELKLDTAFLKQSDGKPMPAVVYIHGGGWRTGNKDMGMRPSMAMALGGYFAVTIQYRLSDQAIFPAAVHDCKAAIRFLRANAEQLGIDPERIGVWGHSAGGHLSALLGTSGNTEVLNGSVGSADPKTSTAVQCVVNISGPTDLTRDVDGGLISMWLGGNMSEKQAEAKQASPLTYIDAKDPPVLIVHGTTDRLVDMDRHAVPLEKALKDAGVKVELLPVPGDGHIITNARAYLRAAEFFDTHLGGNSAERLRENMRNAASGDGQRQRPAPQGDRPARPSEESQPTPSP